MLSRVDDVINVSEYPLGKSEIKNALNQHSRLSELDVVGFRDDIKGQSIFAYVVLP